MSALVLDPEILAARQRQAAAFPALDPASLPPAEARGRMNVAASFFNDGGPPVADIRECKIPAAAGPIGGRLYIPEKSGGDGTALLFVHGGGWFNCNLDTHDRLCRLLALGSGRAVLAIDYRLAPEHPFPAALDDCRAAWRWLAAVAPALGVDPAKIALAGDSAGANLALAVALAERDAGGSMPDRIALAYGCFAPDFETDTQRTLGDGRFGLTTLRMRWYWRNYIGPDLDNPPILAAPSRVRLTGLPKTFLGFAELDVLADETRMMAEKLAAARVEHVLESWPGAPHGLLQMTRDSALARQAAASIAAFLGADLRP